MGIRNRIIPHIVFLALNSKGGRCGIPVRQAGQQHDNNNGHRAVDGEESPVRRARGGGIGFMTGSGGGAERPDIVVSEHDGNATLVEVKSTMRTITWSLLLQWFYQIQTYLVLRLLAQAMASSSGVKF